MEFLLLVIIGLLTYIAFFTPERRRERLERKLNERVTLLNAVYDQVQKEKDLEEENLDKVVKEQTAIDLANGIPPYKTEGELWNAIFRVEPRNEEHSQARITLLKDLEEQKK